MAEEVTVLADGVALPDGLVMRGARHADLDQIGALLTERGDAVDAVDHRLVVEDPDAGWTSCAVVVDGHRIVSTATLLNETLRIGDISLPAGQVELVATHRDYEGRGLVRALMAWAHRVSAARGHLLQVMIGIPYFYRLFGYAYAIDIPGVREASAPPPEKSTGILRVARRDDIPAMVALQEAAQRGVDVTMPHSVPRWRWLIAHEGSTTWVIERDGAVVATGRATPPEDGLLLAEAAAEDEVAARDLLRGVIGLARSAGDAPVRVVDRPGTVTDAAWAGLLTGKERTLAEQYYVRVPHPAALFDRLAPLLWRRLKAAGMEHARKELVISTFRAHYRIPVGRLSLGPVVTGGTMQAPGAVGGAGVARDRLGALLFGQLGIAGLAKIHPDVYPGPDRELYEVLFPPQTADLLTYYLPF
jgi:hypothetical protein